MTSQRYVLITYTQQTCLQLCTLEHRQYFALYLKIFMYLHCYNTGKNLFFPCTEMQEILKRDLKRCVYLHKLLQKWQDIKTCFTTKFYTQRELKTQEVLSNWNYTTYVQGILCLDHRKLKCIVCTSHTVLQHTLVCMCVQDNTATCSAKVAEEGMPILYHHKIKWD